jgi:hypothetical protein
MLQGPVEVAALRAPLAQAVTPDRMSGQAETEATEVTGTPRVTTDSAAETARLDRKGILAVLEVPALAGPMT